MMFTRPTPPTQEALPMIARTLTLSTGTSRGMNTYGYLIVRLRDSATGKLYRCNGGGYDMVGTVLADWLTDQYQDALAPLAGQAFYSYGKGQPYTRAADERSALYGMAVNLDTGRVSIDGACGVESVRRIAKAVGVKLTSLPSQRGETAGWSVGDV
jgi:hypothetical protein